MFITFEGGEGAGKTTLINRIEQTLIQRGYAVVKTREPGGSKLGEYIRGWLLNRDFTIQVGKKAELLLFLAGRAQHIEEIILPALKSGKVVLCDRFNDSTIAYQGVARGLGFEVTEQLCLQVCGDLIPRITFFLDVDTTVGLNRTRRASKENASSGQVDRIEAEALEFHDKVRNGFQLLAKKYPHRIVTLDANKSKDFVYQEAWQYLEKELTKT